MDRDALSFLRDLTAAVVEASRVRENETVGDMPFNTTGGTLIRPGGRDCYPSFWVRDFALSLDCDLVSQQEIQHGVTVIARCQNGDQTRNLESGATIPPFAIADHVNFDGRPVFFPGTYSPGEDQGGGPWGALPPVDDHYYFIHAAYRLWRGERANTTLQQRIAGMPLIDRLHKAFDAPQTDAQTGMVATYDAQRAVGFGFCDTVQMTGQMLFCSLLRWRAAQQLKEMCEALGHADKAQQYNATADRIAAHLPAVFADEAELGGWLRAATETCRQADVWGTLFALHLNVLPADVAARAEQTVIDAVERGTIEYLGAVRHIPTDMDFSPHTAWERCVAAYNTYQNGTYWHTPTGWLIAAVDAKRPDLARQLLDRYIAHLRDEDFRQSSDHHAPWECFDKEGLARQNPVYLTSVTVPLAVVSQLE